MCERGIKNILLEKETGGLRQIARTNLSASSLRQSVKLWHILQQKRRKKNHVSTDGIFRTIVVQCYFDWKLRLRHSVIILASTQT